MDLTLGRTFYAAAESNLQFKRMTGERNDAGLRRHGKGDGRRDEQWLHDRSHAIDLVNGLDNAVQLNLYIVIFHNRHSREWIRRGGLIEVMRVVDVVVRLLEAGPAVIRLCQPRIFWRDDIKY